MASNASPQDLDAMARTMVAEGGSNPDSQLAVGSVIGNRWASGSYGDTPLAVVSAPSQFSTWSNGAARRVDPNSAAYQTAKQIAADVIAGSAPDPTGGATHFYAPSGMPGGRPPSWAKGPGLNIGGNVFSAPEGAVVRKQQQQGSGPDVDGLLSAWGAGGSSQGGSQPQSTTAATPAASGPGSGPDVDGLLSAWGAAPASTSTAAPSGPDNPPIDPADHPLTIRTKVPAATATAQTPATQPGPSQAGDASAAIGRGIVDGIPVVGPYAASGLDHVAAVARAIKENVPYSQALQEVQGFGDATAAAHPTATAWGEAGGAGLGYGALGATRIGARALGMVGDNLLMRAATGAVTNAAIGGGDAAVRSGGDPTSTLVGAGIGLGAGMAGPIVGRGIEMGANKLAPYIQSFQPSQAAPNALQQVIEGTGGNLDDMAARLKANPRLSIMDVNPGARNIAQGLAAQPGKARDTLVAAYGQRAAGAENAVTGAYDAAMGPTPDVKATLDGIKATAAANAKQGFGEALKGASPVDLSPAIDALDRQIHPGVNAVVSTPSNIPLSPIQQRLQQIRGMLTDGKSVLTDPARLHQIQSQLRTEGETLLASSTGSDRLMGRAVMNARDDIVGAIDDATGGAFRPAQKQYADDMSIQDAFNKGLSIFSNRAGETGLEDRPEYWRAFLANASPGEKDALTLGARTAVDQQMNSVRNATRKGAAIPEVGFNLDKLKAVLGDKEASKLAQHLADEQDIAKTNNALFEGSQTQPRQQAKAATAVRELAPISAEIGLPTFAAMNGAPWTAAGLTAAALARRGVQYAGQRADLARNALQANMLSATGPARDAAVNRLMAAGSNALPTFAQGAGQVGNKLMLATAPSASSQVMDLHYKRPQSIGDVNRLLRATNGH